MTADITSLLEYRIGEDVAAFSSRKYSSLPYDVLTSRQVHGSEIAVIDRVPVPGLELDGYDAIVTSVKGLAVGVRTADCVPVLLYDRARGVSAAIHSGWRGTVRKICSKTVSLMRNHYGSVPADISAVIGPSIGKNSYQVGEEVVDLFREQGFPLDRIWYFLSGDTAAGIHLGHHIDLKAANRFLLEKSGIPSERIFDCGIDTFTDHSFFSARRETSATGRIISAIMML